MLTDVTVPTEVLIDRMGPSLAGRGHGTSIGALLRTVAERDGWSGGALRVTNVAPMPAGIAALMTGRERAQVRARIIDHVDCRHRPITEVLNVGSREHHLDHIFE